MFGLTFHLYGLFIGLAILTGFQASLWLAKKRKISVQLIEELFWWVIGGGIIGARLYHVIDKWKEIYLLNPVSALYVWNGGLGIWGALIGGVIGLLSYYVIRLKGKTNFFNLLDVAIVGVPLGQAIGRLGNFFNQELYGRVTNLPWGIPVAGQTGKFHPLFAYEAVLNLVLFGVLVRISRIGRVGQIAGYYLIGYGLIRLMLEPLRPEAIIWKIAGVPTASWISLGAILLGVYILKRKN